MRNAKFDLNCQQHSPLSRPRFQMEQAIRNQKQIWWVPTMALWVSVLLKFGTVRATEP